MFTFHVPLFFIISGYFLSLSSIEVSDFAKKRFRQLIRPYIWTSFALIVLGFFKEIVKSRNIIEGVSVAFYYLTSALYGSGTTNNRTPFGIGSIGTIWFLLALFWGQLIVKIIYKLDKSTVRLALIALIFAISVFTAHMTQYPLAIQNGGEAAAFIFFGSELRRKNINLNAIKHSYLLIIAGVCFMLLVLTLQASSTKCSTRP